MKFSWKNWEIKLFLFIDLFYFFATNYTFFLIINSLFLIIYFASNEQFKYNPEQAWSFQFQNSENFSELNIVDLFYFD